MPGIFGDDSMRHDDFFARADQFQAAAQARDRERRQRWVASQRDNPAFRAVTARAAVLDWVYQRRKGHREPFDAWLATGKFRVERDRITNAEVNEAADYLAAQGLVKIVAGSRPGAKGLHLTSKGADCMENFDGDVTEYVKEQNRRGSRINIGTIHGPVGIGDNNSISQTMGVDPRAMAAFVQSLLSALPDLRLEAGQQARAEAALQEVQREVERIDPDPERVQGAFARFAKGMVEAGPKAMTELMLMFARGYLGPGS
ncbi:hypothetical protein OHA21_27380 [Actinoplanes sp. NBC_00393]|uniref:hypothetical protein n=1 Tax=Actinoplanes sp. NBC_00393 TaxID=2975953 RepID=UPI002E2398AE